MECRNDVEDDSPSRFFCRACVAKVEAQRAAGALRRKMPSILVGRCKAHCLQVAGCRLQFVSCVASPQGKRLQVAGYKLHGRATG